MSVTGVVVRSVLGSVVLLILALFVWQVAAGLYVGLLLGGAALDLAGRLPRGRRRLAVAVFGWWFVRPAFVAACVVETFAEFLSLF